MSPLSVSHHSVNKKKEAALDVRTQTEMRSEKGEEIGCQTAALTTPINVNKKVPVMLKQSRAKRPLLRNTIHAQVHVCLAGGYTTHLSGNTVGCFQFHRKFNVFGLLALGKGNKITRIALRVMYYMQLKYLLPCLHIRFRISRTTKASAKS